MKKNDGANNGKEGSDELGNLGGETPKENKTPEISSEKLLELVTKLSSRIEDLEQQNKDLLDLKSSNKGLDTNGLAELIKEVKKGNLEQSETRNPLRYYSPEEIDPDDVLQEPVIFYAYGYGYVITDNRINGKPVLTPFGQPIFFMHQATQKVGSGKHVELHSYCTYPSWSKKEVEWLRKHNRFGIHFFETAKEAMDVNSDVAARITKHLNAINGLEPAQIVNMYRKKGLPNTTDIVKMKNSLALEAVKEEVQNERSSQEKYFKDVFDKNYQDKQAITGGR